MSQRIDLETVIQPSAVAKRLCGTAVNRQCGNAGRFGIGALQACQKVILPRGLAYVPTNQRCDAPGGETAKKHGRTRLSQDWQSTGDANAIRSAAARAEPDQEAGERQQLDASTPACQDGGVKNANWKVGPEADPD